MSALMCSLGLAGDEQQALTCIYFSVAPEAVTSGGRPQFLIQ